MRAAYKWVATLTLVAVVCQIGFAGYGAFYAAHKIDDSTPKAVTDDQFEHGFDWHGLGGAVVIGLVLILLVVGVIAGVGRWRLGKHGVLALLLVVQFALAGAAFAVPAFGFLHAVNALVVLATTGWIVRGEWRPDAAPEEAAAAA